MIKTTPAWDAVIADLISLAASRKDDGFEEWSDVAAIEEVLREVEHKVEAMYPKSKDIVKLAYYQMHTCFSLVKLSTTQLKAAKNENVTDSVLSYAKLALCFEKLLLIGSGTAFEAADEMSRKNSLGVAADMQVLAYDGYESLQKLLPILRNKQDALLKIYRDNCYAKMRGKVSLIHR
jgi:hypothetical protein